MDILQNIKKYSTLSLTEIERLCGFPKSSMRKWNENTPSVKKVMKVCEVLNIGIQELLTGEESEKKLAPEEQELLNLYRSLTEKEKGKAEVLLEQLAEESAERKEKKSS